MARLHHDDCGNCIHWKPWSDEKQKKYWEQNVFSEKRWKPGDLRLGNCDIAQTVCPIQYVTEYSFGIFEDENYNEEFGCFEGRANQ